MLISVYAGPFEFSGSASMYAEHNYIYGIPHQDSATTLRFNINPQLTVYGMPISFNISLNSEESDLRQALNKFSMFLQPSRLVKEMVNMPGFVFSISGISIGTCYPYYSPLTLTGIPVTGGAVEMNPWVIYLAATAGRIQRGVMGSDTTDAAYARTLYAGRFGLGKKDGTHLFFTMLYAGDDTSSITPYTLPVPGDSDTVEVITPQENYCAGVEFNLSLFQNHFTLQSEIVGSQFTRDIRMPELIIPGAPLWVTDIFNPRMSSSFDYAYSVKPSLTILNTRIWGGFKMIGPGFNSLGVPYLRNDNLSFEMGVSQNLFNNSIALSASHTREHDNLIGNKLSTTFFTSYIFNLGLNFRNLPYFQVGYTPFRQYDDSTDCQSDILNLNTGYNFFLFGMSHAPSFSWFYQDYQELSDTNNYISNTFSIYENVGFQFPLSISSGVGITTTDYTNKKERIVSLDISTAYTFFQQWTNTIGFIMSSDQNKDSRYGINYNSSFPLWWFGNINFSVERNIYIGERQEEDYNEWRLIGTISKSW